MLLENISSALLLMCCLVFHCASMCLFCTLWNKVFYSRTPDNINRWSLLTIVSKWSLLRCLTPSKTDGVHICSKKGKLLSHANPSLEVFCLVRTLIWALDIYDAKNALEKDIWNKVKENLEDGYKSNERTLPPPNSPTAEKLTGLFL